MSAVIYYIALPFIYLLSILPFRVLYLVSDGLYVLLYYVLGYRKAVVLQNLQNSFPDKSDAEIKEICKRYYKYLCDLFLETFKTLTISKAKMQKHCYFNPASKAFLDKLAAENKSTILVMGHLGNWEWAGNTVSLQLKQQLYVIYHPISNKYFDWLMYNMRSRFGTKLIKMKNTFRDMLENREELSITAFIADQTPPPDSAYWTTFLNQDTPIFKGTELIARKINYPVVYARVVRVKRGYYEMFVDMLCENPKATKEGEISEMHTRRLEKDIIAQPEVWLWSHRRWKHKRPQQ
ncbi:MAG: lysophospholipid acyltransferase family protein [Bacteroidetes bacterium]|nr:lysophospholipid acyltransferase family protein [Bacteroidota bacterium]